MEEKILYWSESIYQCFEKRPFANKELNRALVIHGYESISQIIGSWTPQEKKKKIPFLLITHCVHKKPDDLLIWVQYWFVMKQSLASAVALLL